MSQTIPLRDFFRNPEQTGFKISPDGRFISHLAPWGSRLNLFVTDRETRKVTQITKVTERDVRDYFWKGNNTLIFSRDFGGDENFHLFAADAQVENVRDITPFPDVVAQVIDDLEELDDVLMISLNKRDKQVFDVYRLNVATGELTLVMENPGNIITHITDHDGKLRAAITTDGVNSSLLYRENEQDAFKAIVTTSFKEAISPQLFTFDNKRLYVLSNIGRDRMVALEFDPATGAELQVLFEHDEVDIDRISYSRKKQQLSAITYTTWKKQRTFFDRELEAIFTDIESRLEGHEISIVSHDRSETLYIIRSFSDRSLGAFYLYDVKSKTLDKLADVSPWLKPAELSPITPISFTSRDGLTINGYLTLPVKTEPRDLPVVINPHGGPWVRDTWQYNPEVQFLANRGYAVLQVNYRGSTGYGRKFWEASFKQWGRKMQDDLTDGVHWLIAEGIADPKRVGIYGGSYGGYATLAGLAFTPDLYACGVDYVGVSNLFTFMETIPPYWKPFLEMMYEMVGDPVKDKELLEAASPVFHVDKIRSPLFVAQGANDPRVKIAESDQIVAALRAKGVDVPYMVKENEGHGFSNEENRFEFYEAMEAFLERHLQPTK